MGTKYASLTAVGYIFLDYIIYMISYRLMKRSSTIMLYVRF